MDNLKMEDNYVLVTIQHDREGKFRTVHHVPRGPSQERNIRNLILDFGRHMSDPSDPTNPADLFRSVTVERLRDHVREAERAEPSKADPMAERLERGLEAARLAGWAEPEPEPEPEPKYSIKLYYHEVIVTGKGEFPIECLTPFRAFPEGWDAALLITQTQHRSIKIGFYSVSPLNIWKDIRTEVVNYDPDGNWAFTPVPTKA